MKHTCSTVSMWSPGQPWLFAVTLQSSRSAPSDTIGVGHDCLRIILVRELLHQYFNIAFLMGKPQDLPGGSAQMKIGVFLALLTYLMALVVPYGMGRALLHAVIDLGATAIIAYLVLQVVGHSARFFQAFGGLCGASAFINLAAIPLYAFGRGDQGESSFLLQDLVLLVWGLSLLGHVIRHTFEISMVMSIVASFLYFIFLTTLIAALLPLNSPETSQLSNINILEGLQTVAVYWSGKWSIG